MKTKIIFCLCVLIASNAWAETILDIDSAVKQALENNLSLKRSEMDTLSAKRKYNRSWNGLIPSLSAGAMAAHPTSVTGSIPEAADKWTPGFNLSASMTISPATFANINQTKQEYAAGHINYAAARRELEFQVRRLYYQILLLKANAELAQLNIESAQNRYEQTVSLQRAGRASNLDELSARLDVQTQQANAQNAQAVYNNALDSLKYFLMISMEETVVLQGDLQNLTVRNNATEDWNTGGGESMQMSVLRQSISAIEAQRKSLQLRSYAPALTFSWNAAPLYIDQPGVGWRDSSGQFSIALSFKLDNYLPWSPAKEQIDTLNDAINSQQSLLTESAINHQNTVQKLIRDIARSQDSIETLRLNITLAEETLRMYTVSYRNGAVDLQTLNSTRDNLRTAQNRLLTEQFNLLSTILELEKELNLPFGSIAQEM
jgi:outer membrane protein TolC